MTDTPTPSREALLTERANLVAAPALATGWRMVPVEPDKATIKAGVAFALKVSLGADYRWSDYMRDLWYIMLAASPAQPAEKGDERDARHAGPRFAIEHDGFVGAGDAASQEGRLEKARLRAAIHRLGAAGDNLTGWITTADATDAVALWRIQLIEATAIASGKDPKAAVQDYANTARAALAGSKGGLEE